MELVYLWVEKYKNIENQGFNFSPRYECKYDDETRELTIDEKKDYVSIFPENINVTAFVGKNGAGKSTIQKLIFLLIFLKKYENFEAKNPIDIEKEDAIIEIFKNDIFKNKNIFLIVNTATGLKKISLLQSIQNYDNSTINSFKSKTKICPLQNQYNELQPSEINFFSIHFHYMIDTWFDGYHTADDWTLTLYHRVDGFKTPLLLEPYKGHKKDKQYIDISNMEYLNNQHMFDLYGQLTEELEFNKFFNPESIWMMIDSKKLINKFLKFNDTPISGQNKENFESFIELKVGEKDLNALNKLYLGIKIIESNKDLFNDEKITSHLQDVFLNATSHKKLNDVVNSYNFDNLLKTTGLNETKKLEVCIEFDKAMRDINKLEKYKEFLVLDPSNIKTNTLKEVRDIFENILPWVEVEFHDKNKNYISLSSGEKAFLNFAMNLLYQIDNINRNGHYRTINLFLDEVEYSLHPEWQREFLNLVLFLLKNFDTLQFNLFFATHSPFLLSDLPKENVIFLEKGEQEEQEDVNINPFGANIHTLLSHGFFMNDGLMGEFAKEKINNAIKYLNQKSLSEEEIHYCENIISIVGEPILKRQLQKMLDSKRLIKIDKINELEDEIELMKYRIEMLRNNQ